MLSPLALALLTLSPAPQQAPAKAAAFELPALREKLDAANGPWVAFLDTPTLTTGVYRLAAGAADGQSPHARDEVYHVLEGKAVLEVDGKRLPANPGSTLFVAAHAPHRFVDIEEDLTVLVFFSSAIPETGGMIAGPRPTRQTPYPETSPRASTRIFYWFGPGSAGQVEIDHGLPAWQPAYAKMLAPQKTMRWRFGQNFWTRLDTNIDLTIGGVRLPAGYYYLALESHVDEGLRLIALDPAEVRSQLLDAYQAPQTTGGVALPLTREDDGQFTRRLSMTLDVVEEDGVRTDRATLEIRFGPHRLIAPIEMHPAG